MITDLVDYLKDSKNPLRVVFVCAMWLTGFDVKCLSCLYLDKPLKAHTLMQTIARANRVSEGKSNGLIIDYIGIVKALRKALADYTANAGGNAGSDPTIDKDELITRIIETIGKANVFLKENDFDLEMLINSYDFMKLSYLQEAANAVCGSIEDKKTLLNLTIGQISKKQKQLLIILSVIHFGQNYRSVTMKLASLCIVSKFMNMFILDTEQLLN